jgi:hypothetical protein
MQVAGTPGVPLPILDPGGRTARTSLSGDGPVAEIKKGWRPSDPEVSWPEILAVGPAHSGSIG